MGRVRQHSYQPDRARRLGNVTDNTFNAPSGVFRGVSLRSYDRDSKQWLSWWLDSRNPSHIQAPERGSFKEGVGTFLGNDVHDGKAIMARSQWSRITPTSAHWEQAWSADGGATWETNWISELTRKS